MFPLSLAISYVLKVDVTELAEAYKNRRDEFVAAVHDVIEKNDIIRLMDSNKMEFLGVISRTADALSMGCGKHTVGQHFDATFPCISRMRELPCIMAYSPTTYRTYFPIEEIVISPKMDRVVQMANLVDVLCDLFRTSPKWLRTRITDSRNWQAASILLANLQLRTTHLKTNKEVKFGALEHRGSSRLPAYNGYLGVTVRQHYYARHRIPLRYPYLPCVSVTGPNGQKDFYPLEVLKVVQN